MDIPTITSLQAAQIGDLATRHFGIDALQLMENAGSSVAEVARIFLGRVVGKQITILCGKGNNGGDGLVAARFLSNWGAKVKVIFPYHPDELSKEARGQKGVLRSMFIESLHATDVHQFEDAIKKADLVVDGLIGSSNGDPEGTVADIIRFTNENAEGVLAIDMPSGLDPDTGKPYNPCIVADATITFCLPKRGLLGKSARVYVGKLYLADIGIPHEVFEKMGWSFPKVFGEKSLIKV